LSQIRASLLLPTFVCLVMIMVGCSGFASAITSATPLAGQSYPTESAAQAETASSPGVIKVSDLPSEGKKTLQLIKSGGPFLYSQDGAVFNNFERLLPAKASGYYHEYTVFTPGSSDRGARRIIAGESGEYYYTDDHYNSFKLIVE
jgi:ribonuclease T1